MSDRSPALNRAAFECPHCGVYAAQTWHATYISHQGSSSGLMKMDGVSIARCAACPKFSFWVGDAMIFPLSRLGPPASDDTPDDVLEVYDEARVVAGLSPKSAAGLLRLGLQMLVDELEPGRASIDSKIGALVDKGLDPRVQQAMDVLRVAGNEAVHPGTMDLDADRDLLASLFGLLNVIVEQVITRPKHIEGLFVKLPEEKREAIERRDRRGPSEGPNGGR